MYVSKYNIKSSSFLQNGLVFLGETQISGQNSSALFSKIPSTVLCFCKRFQNVLANVRKKCWHLCLNMKIKKLFEKMRFEKKARDDNGSCPWSWLNFNFWLIYIQTRSWLGCWQSAFCSLIISYFVVSFWHIL